jgi:hypothetical protein
MDVIKVLLDTKIVLLYIIMQNVFILCIFINEYYKTSVQHGDAGHMSEKSVHLLITNSEFGRE